MGLTNDTSAGMDTTPRIPLLFEFIIIILMGLARTPQLAPKVPGY